MAIVGKTLVVYFLVDEKLDIFFVNKLYKLLIFVNRLVQFRCKVHRNGNYSLLVKLELLDVSSCWSCGKFA